LTDIIESPARTAEDTTFGLTRFLDPLRVPPVIRPHSWWQQDEITVTARATRVRLHSQLPETTVWAYDGHFPGPTIEVRSGQRLRVAWTNDVEGTLPLVAVQAPLATAPGNRPGDYRNPDGSLQDGVSIIAGVADVPAWHVTHLHGARTNGGNDGWAHNAVLRGASQLTEYPNAQPSMTLWYHDHAMAITRFNVHTGLAGVYLVRDDEEAALDLPHGDQEIPLVICDRNLDTDAAGNLTGQLLYKIGYLPGAVQIPFTGPFNLVNGVIWPHLDVAARWYRFRLLNAANSRFYTLNLVDDAGVSHNDAIRQIGTDGGLLPVPTPLPTGGLTLAPAERADVLIDFGRLRGTRLRLTDTSVTRDASTGRPVTEPDLMQFRVEDRDGDDRFTLPEKISRSYVRLQHGTTVPEDHDHIWIALAPPGAAGEGHPAMWELSEITDPARIPPLPAAGVIQLTDPNTGALRTFQRVADMFDDTVSIFIDHDRWAIWNLIHLGGPTHPVHIHLTEFQALSRSTVALPDGTIPEFDVAAGGTKPGSPLRVRGDRGLDKNEEGWKDTFRVGPGDWVSVAGQFTGGTGEFMYHCHILDHEDEGMMRPFVVMPKQVSMFHMHHGGSGHQH
jgi:FtsP/CotA-like multicopper oxidase with cupredoxin domain